MYLSGNRIYVERAPEPNDIEWKNMRVPFKNKVFYASLTAIFTLLVIGIIFYILKTLTE